MKFLKSIYAHAKWWGETYFGIPFVLLAVFGILHLYSLLTGRKTEEQPDILIGFVYNAVGIIISASLVGFIQRYLVGYRSEKPDPSFVDDFHDSCVTLVLFSVVCWFVFK